MRGDYMLSAVTKAVVAKFGGDMVLVERPTQNAPGAYLFVHQLNRDQNPDNGPFHNRHYFFDIRYHPDDRTGTEHRNFTIIEEKLTDALAYISTDDQLAKASSMRSEIQNGVLHFFVDYPIRVMLQKEFVPDMEELDINENIKTRE